MICCQESCPPKVSSRATQAPAFSQNPSANTPPRGGNGIAQKRIGERVWLYKAQTGQAFGTAAEYVTLPAERAVPLRNADFKTGTTLGIPAITAHRCLFADGDLRGQSILVHGGGGAVGAAAILLAKWAGARVATTISREGQANAARHAGAEVIINHSTENIPAEIMRWTGGNGVNRIVDVDLRGQCRNRHGLSCTRWHCLKSGHPPVCAVYPPCLTAQSFVLFFLHHTRSSLLPPAAGGIRLCLAGAYQPKIATRFPLEKSGKRMRYRRPEPLSAKFSSELQAETAPSAR